MDECVIHPFPGWHVGMRWIAPDPVPPESALAGVALAALDVLREVVEPLSADLDLVCADPLDRWPRGYARPARAFWHLRNARRSELVRNAPMYVGAIVSEVSQLDRERLQGWIEQTLAQPCDGAGTKAVTAWGELAIRASCARLHRECGTSKLILQSEAGPLEVPIRDADGVRWVCGPVAGAPTQPPIGVFLRREGRVLSLEVNGHWSWWTAEGSPEREVLDSALGRLRGSGWEKISTDLGEPGDVPGQM